MAGPPPSSAAGPADGEPARPGPGSSADAAGPVPGWLADPALAPLWEAARNRLERSHLVPAGRVILTGLDRAERHAVGDLLARPLVTDRVAVDLAELDQVLARRSQFRGLAGTVAAVTGRPVRDLLAERSAVAAARAEPLTLARGLLAAEPVLAGIAWAETWLAAIRRAGLLTRTADPIRAVRDAVAVLAEVLALAAAPGAAPAAGAGSAASPAAQGNGAGSRTDLAARVTGSAHGLDDGTVVAQLTLRALALDAGAEPPLGAAERRDLWERYGVSGDSVSSTCLTLGLGACGGGPVARRLRVAAQAGDPVHITPRDLRHLDFAPHRQVLVCENPRVLEAVADGLPGGVPAVCTAGQPKLVTLELLRRLAATGTALRYHGDFDWPGIAIANRLITEAGVRPWLMDAGDYRAAARRGPVALELSGTPVPASWDPALSEAMRRLGVAVHEEAVLDDLLARLTPGSAGLS
jgi:uncharacterized protein (TIGR02679 family)